jgi:hypothetical protein
LLFIPLFLLVNNVSFFVGQDDQDPDYQVTYPQLKVTDLRSNKIYVVAYINIARNTVTGIFPLISLAILNYLVYKHLVRRRRGVAQIGNLPSRKYIVHCRPSIGKALITFFPLAQMICSSRSVED